MSGTAGKVALVSTTTPLTGACPTGGAIVDFVGYGAAATASKGPGSDPGAPEQHDVGARNGGGATTRTTTPPTSLLGTRPARADADPAPTVASTTPPPANGASGVALAANITITFSEPVNVTGAWFTINCATSGRPHRPSPAAARPLHARPGRGLRRRTSRAR